MQPPQRDPDQIRRTADEVLSGRAYQTAARPPSLQERIFDWIGDRFSDLFNSLSSSGSRGLIAWVVIILFAAVILYLVSRLMRNFGALPKPSIQPKPTIDVTTERSSKQWLAAAAEAEDAGDYRQGIRCRHQALVSSLVEKRLVAVGPDQTAGEINQLVSAQFPPVATPMNEATWLFQDTWYGWVHAGASSRDRFMELAAAIARESGRNPTDQSDQSDLVTA